MKTIYYEVQKFNQWWLWLIIIGIAALPFISLIPMLSNSEENPFQHFAWPIVIYITSVIAIIWLFLYIQLSTKIDSKGITMKFRPFTSKSFLWSEIVSAEVVDYGFIGGWGIRYGTKYGTVYNTSGSKGIALKLKDGKQICIGTQQSDELKNIIEKYKNS